MLEAGILDRLQQPQAEVSRCFACGVAKEWESLTKAGQVSELYLQDLPSSQSLDYAM